jgi:hypothetical protein
MTMWNCRKTLLWYDSRLLVIAAHRDLPAAITKTAAGCDRIRNNSTLLVRTLILCANAKMSLDKRRYLYLATRLLKEIEKDLLFLDTSQCQSKQIKQLCILCNNIKTALFHCFRNVCEEKI